ncbi:hypothetical protein EK21DRAFT_100492 [Setomelanomma holmii]|uniref:Phosphoribosyltransferase domain-containing protein n=1 Tax=Setomelanomma holmii TaxID=210430 RepID=A0A9P4LN88_9PLEO|nr:hypothetical protein EK21DRAFT_100492 [Setomelanomma holmii]
MSVSARECSVEPPSNAAKNPTRAKALDKHENAKVIGIYGMPGSGKTTLLGELKHILDMQRFSFYEGSEMIAKTVSGGLAAFQKLDGQRKTKARQLAIKTIRDNCAKDNTTAVVTGHFMFWREEITFGDIVCTDGNLDTYSQIIYLNVSPETIDNYLSNDATKQRDSYSVAHLRRWQQAELTEISSLCQKHSILFSAIDAHQIAQGKVHDLILDFDLHSEGYNSNYAEDKLDDIVRSYLTGAETVVVIEGDKTLTSHDTGALFYEMVSATQQREQHNCPLKALFSGPLRYTYTAFRQATLLCEETSNDDTYEDICQQVASVATLHAEFVALLRLVARLAPVGAIIACATRWASLQGGRIADGMVVTAAIKANIVTRLQTCHDRSVWAFGDSPLDLEMLKVLDQAVVVMIKEQKRCKSMESALLMAINHENLRSRQVVIPDSSSPRLDIKTLPLLDISSIQFVNALLQDKEQATGLSISVAVETASKLLATPMYDAAIQGPRLREAHQRAGNYFALEHVSRIIGLEHCSISHVLGRPTSGYQLDRESQTTILALIRGGDPMALGVSEAFPRAMYVHVKELHDLQLAT